MTVDEVIAEFQKIKAELSGQIVVYFDGMEFRPNMIDVVIKADDGLLQAPVPYVYLS